MMVRSGFFGRYLLPGFSFQAVVIGGGYSTGRELAEFFLPGGPVGGLLGLILCGAIWSLVLALTFELVRLIQSLDYKALFKSLLGPGWIILEIAFLALTLLVLAVTGAAAGTIGSANLGASPILYTGLFAMLVGILALLGSGVIERVFAGWSFLLYATYASFLLFALVSFGGRIAGAFDPAEIKSEWLLGSVRYAAYNLAVVPAVLFSLRHVSSRKEALWAGALAGPLGIAPALLFFIAMIGFYPEIGDDPVPSDRLLAEIGLPWFSVVFYVVILGTLIETGAGIIHAINERIAASRARKRRGFGKAGRALSTFAILLISVVVADRVGLIDLVAKGYGLIAWIFILGYILPILTIGALRIWGPIRFRPESKRH
jgi:uncharacterized membrane protein YkvI